MSKIIRTGLLALCLVRLAAARPFCPVTLVSGSGGRDGFTVTFWNSGKLPIRRLEFNCRPLHAQTSKTHLHPCREENALFFPGSQYTLGYPYPDGMRRPILLSVKSVTLSDGYVWIPDKRRTCHVLLNIYLDKSKK